MNAAASAWVERAATHLVKRSYSEPRWSRSAGSAVADERVTLYGVPLAAGRPVPVPAAEVSDFFAQAYPRLARDGAVVAGADVTLPAPEQTTLVATVRFLPEDTIRVEPKYFAKESAQAMRAAAGPQARRIGNVMKTSLG